MQSFLKKIKNISIIYIYDLKFFTIIKNDIDVIKCDYIMFIGVICSNDFQ